MSMQLLARPGAPRAAFGKIVHNEARLAWRQPSGLIAGIGIALLLLVIFGEVPVFRQSSPRLGGLSAFEVYIPVLIAFSIGVLALTYLPGPLVSYREQGILRRLSTTPVPASWVLAAQFVVAMTVIPLFCSRFLKQVPHAEGHGRQTGSEASSSPWLSAYPSISTT